MRKTSDRFMLSTNETDLFTLMRTAKAIEAKCSDYSVERLASNAKFEGDFLSYKATNGEQRKAKLSTIATTQVCNRYGVSSRYMNKCLDAGYDDLFAENMNRWMRNPDNDGNAFVREYDGHIRGFLSDRYTACDTSKVIKALFDSSLDLNEFAVKGFYLDETRFHARLVKKEMLHIDGEDLFAGLSITSSDVGINAISINFFIYKQVCSNGLVVSKLGGTLLKQRHIGIDASQLKVAVKEAVEKFDDLCAVVAEAIDKNRRIVLSGEDIEKLLLRARKDIQLSKKTEDKILELMDTKYGRTKWGFINGITEIAKVYDIDKRLDFETYAGKLLA